MADSLFHRAVVAVNSLCSQFGLEVVSDLSLHDFLYTHIDQHHQLLRRMGVSNHHTAQCQSAT